MFANKCANLLVGFLVVWFSMARARAPAPNLARARGPGPDPGKQKRNQKATKQLYIYIYIFVSFFLLFDIPEVELLMTSKQPWFCPLLSDSMFLPIGISPMFSRLPLPCQRMLNGPTL